MGHYKREIHYSRTLTIAHKKGLKENK